MRPQHRGRGRLKKRDESFRHLGFAAIIWVVAIVVLAFAGMGLNLGDTPVTGTTSITLDQAIFTSGTIVSPPVVVALLATLLLLGAVALPKWPARVLALLLIIGVAVVGIDTQGGLHVAAPHYSAQTWVSVLIIGWSFVVLCAATVLAGVADLVGSFQR